jgi:hypothetical protein
MANTPNPGIGPLRSAQEHLDDKTADEDSGGDSEEGNPVTQPPSGSETPPSPTDTDDENDSDDGPIGEGSGTMVYDNSPQTSGPNEVGIKCEATSCIFNRQRNCQAPEVKISFDGRKGMRSVATACETYQTAGSGEDD